MSELVPFRGQRIAKAFAGLPPPPALGQNVPVGFSSIRYRGKMWSLQHAGSSHSFVRADDNSPLTYLDLIILGQQPAVSKVYFPGEFNEDEATGPVCQSLKGDVPDPGVSIPQSKTCVTCKHYGWGTGRDGRGKACQDYQRLAVLVLPTLTKKMLGAPLMDAVFFKVPPGSLQSLRTYGEELKHEGYPSYAVVTRVSFHPDKLFCLVFKGVSVLTDKEAELVKPLLDSPVTRRIIGEQSEIREIKPVQDQIEQVDTGLAEAFEQPAQIVKPAAPVKTKPSPKSKVVEAKPEPLAEEVSGWADSEDELDASIASVTKTAVEDMLK
jgi:hypothetical protein